MTTQTEALKRFLIQTSVENAEGSQTWYVDAENEAEALQKYNNGECDMYANEVEVTSLGQPELAGETTLDDFGDFGDEALAQPERDIAEAYRAELDRLSQRNYELRMENARLKSQRAWIGLAEEDLERCRQWFCSTQDTNGGFLNAADYALAEKLYLKLDMRVPDSIKQAANGIGGKA